MSMVRAGGPPGFRKLVLAARTGEVASAMAPSAPREAAASSLPPSWAPLVFNRSPATPRDFASILATRGSRAKKRVEYGHRLISLSNGRGGQGPNPAAN